MATMTSRLAVALLATCAAWPAAAVERPAPVTGAPFDTASAATREFADWVVASGDNAARPFVVIDKLDARVFVFDATGRLGASAPALLGLTRGDVSPPGIGNRSLASIGPAERVTPAGRFVAAIGRNLGGRDILWVDYASALSLHPVIAGKPAERRGVRLASATSRDNRISYGCINVPVAFYESAIRPAFGTASGMVYILPETRSIHDVFAIPRSGD